MSGLLTYPYKKEVLLIAPEAECRMTKGFYITCNKGIIATAKTQKEAWEKAFIFLTNHKPKDA